MEVVFAEDGVTVAGQLMDGTCVRQTFVTPAKTLIMISVFFTYPARSPEQSFLTLQIRNALSLECLESVDVDTNFLPDSGLFYFPINLEIGVGKRCELMLYTLNCRAGLSPLVYCGKGTSNGYMFYGSKLVRSSEMRCSFIYEDSYE